jgi:LDH2 family malate/lactate/ureidoglycolate dehydrogenase
MPNYPGSDKERRIAMADLEPVVARVFERCDMTSEDAALLANSLVRADLRGIHSHGVMRVPEYVGKLTGKGVNPRGKPRIEKDSGAALLIDGDNNMGQIAVQFAMRSAIERAKTTGVCAAAVRGSNHCGAMDFHAQPALKHDMIGIATTNAIPTMGPIGGIERIVGMNPVGIAVPAATRVPFVFDGSFGMTAHGKIRVYGQKGAKLPQGWATDAQGRPTTDPAVALAGLISPAGAHKGVALGMAMGILSSVLSGAGYSYEAGTLETGAVAGQDGQFVLAINVAAFTDIVEFKLRMDGILEKIVTSRRMAGVERVYYPGLMEHEMEQERRRMGIPLNDQTLADVVRHAEKLGVAADTLR